MKFLLWEHLYSLWGEKKSESCPVSNIPVVLKIGVCIDPTAPFEIGLALCVLVTSHLKCIRLVTCVLVSLY